MTVEYLEEDVVRIYEVGAPKKNKDTLLAALAWGDRLNVVKVQDGMKVIDLGRRDGKRGVLPAKARTSKVPRVLKVRFVDVGQGDGAIIETPSGRLCIVDGGEGEHLRRYFSRSLAYRGFPVPVDVVVATHGDSDHFAGLTRLLEGLPEDDGRPARKLVSAKNVFHNGLVKASAKKVKADTGAIFGSTKKVGADTYCVDLYDDPRTAPSEALSESFQRWVKALGAAKKVQRAAWGDGKLFAPLSAADPLLKIEVLGPITEEVDGAPALRMLRKSGSKGLSDSHTVNGHSVVLKLTYGNVRFLLGADLNEESQAGLLARARQSGVSLAAEILKVPHHGSAEFDPRMLEAVRPVVSVISSGDEVSAKDYIHPRAGLVGALGRFSRDEVDRPLVYVTEMVAFFETIRANDPATGKPIDYAYRKQQFGIVHVRTDGERVLVTTPSAQLKNNETYVFHVSPEGAVRFATPSVL